MNDPKNQFNRAVRIGIILLNETPNPDQEDYKYAAIKAVSSVRDFDENYSGTLGYSEVEKELKRQRE